MQSSFLVFPHDLPDFSLFGCFCFRLFHKLLTFCFLLRRTAHLDLNLDIAFLAVLTFTVLFTFVAAAA